MSTWEAKRGHVIARGQAERRLLALVRAIIGHWDDATLREEIALAIADLDRLGPVGR